MSHVAGVGREHPEEELLPVAEHVGPADVVGRHAARVRVPGGQGQDEQRLVQLVHFGGTGFGFLEGSTDPKIWMLLAFMALSLIYFLSLSLTHLLPLSLSL